MTPCGLAHVQFCPLTFDYQLTELTNDLNTLVSFLSLIEICKCIYTYICIHILSSIYNYNIKNSVCRITEQIKYSNKNEELGLSIQKLTIAYDELRYVSHNQTTALGIHGSVGSLIRLRSSCARRPNPLGSVRGVHNTSHGPNIH